MATISQFFVLSPRGDTIIWREYRDDVERSSAEQFFQIVKKNGGNIKPVFIDQNIHYFSVKKNHLYLVAATKYNVSPSMIIELLQRISVLFKDYCGILSEEAIRRNFILLYELLDEVMDYGLPQATDTEQLKMHVHNSAVRSRGEGPPKIQIGKPKTAAASSTFKPIDFGKSSKASKNEIFVDILERINLVFSSGGDIVNSSIDGCIQLKSYLAGNPNIRVALNENLVIGSGSSAGCTLASCNFHESVDLAEFQNNKVLSFTPPTGEFVLMNYRYVNEFTPPFRITHNLKKIHEHQMELTVELHSDFKRALSATNVRVIIPIPKSTDTVGIKMEKQPEPDPTLPPQSRFIQASEYREKDKQVVWVLKKFGGQDSHKIQLRATIPNLAKMRSREFGPIRISFEIPMYNSSRLVVRYLRILNVPPSYKPLRWVRYVTRSDSYLTRV
jgi:AP-4 complex subunit mu-1